MCPRVTSRWLREVMEKAVRHSGRELKRLAAQDEQQRQVPLGPLGFNSPNIAQRHALP